jgi:hypothetical protein
MAVRTVVWLVLVCVTLCAEREKIQPLQPIRALDVGSTVPEPSGITFCETTQHLYVICDVHNCIYEIFLNGSLVIVKIYIQPVRRKSNLFNLLLGADNSVDL